MTEVASSPADILSPTSERAIVSSPIELFPTFDHTFHEVMTELHGPIANKLVGQVASEYVSRTPSPRSTHFSVPYNGNGHRILRSATVGYVAPEFKGKKEQMLHGEMFLCPNRHLS
jgi:hypothetical protein